MGSGVQDLSKQIGSFGVRVRRVTFRCSLAGASAILVTALSGCSRDDHDARGAAGNQDLNAAYAELRDPAAPPPEKGAAEALSLAGAGTELPESPLERAVRCSSALEEVVRLTEGLAVGAAAREIEVLKRAGALYRERAFETGRAEEKDRQAVATSMEDARVEAPPTQQLQIATSCLRRLAGEG